MATARPRRTWYLLAAIPAAIGAAVVVHSLGGLIDRIEEMPRVVVPGSGEVTLAAGAYLAYGETESVLGGIAYRTGSLQLRCAMQSASGEPVALTAAQARTSYRLSGYVGESMFALDVPRDGAYRLTCEGSGGPATLAIGTGIGGDIVMIVIGALGGVLGAIAVGIAVRLIRRRFLPA